MFNGNKTKRLNIHINETPNKVQIELINIYTNVIDCNMQFLN